MGTPSPKLAGQVPQLVLDTTGSNLISTRKSPEKLAQAYFSTWWLKTKVNNLDSKYMAPLLPITSYFAIKEQILKRAICGYI